MAKGKPRSAETKASIIRAHSENARKVRGYPVLLQLVRDGIACGGSTRQFLRWVERAKFIIANEPASAPETRAHPEGSCLAGGDCDHQWLIRKRGYYYRPNRAGYTASIGEAGRYTEEEAKREAAIEPAIMQAVRLSDVQCTCGVGDQPVRPHDRACPQAEPI